MLVKKKARELGREIRNTPEFKELQQAERSLQDDQSAVQLITNLQELQQQMAFAQKAGTKPSPEQVSQFNDMQEQMKTNITVRSLLKAREEFDKLIVSVNEAISEGITKED